MSYENVKLWFAKNESESIITVDEINEENKKDTYLCPVCGSNLKPKAIKSKQVTSHFAHVDASKCNSESQIHFWFKHKFLEKGDKFTIVSDKERDYIVKDILVEEPYETESGIYKPDVTVLTECGDTIYFEMAFTNKKKVKDYLDLWLELKSVVVEIDIKQLMLRDQIPTFNALFYDGKCFNTKRNDTYYNTVGRYKEEKLKGKVNNELKERIRKLDWFWDDIFRYKEGEVDIEHISTLLENIHKKELPIVFDVLKKCKFNSILDCYFDYKLNAMYNSVVNYVCENFGNEFIVYIRKQRDISTNLKNQSLDLYIESYHEKNRRWYKYKINNESLIKKINEVMLNNKKFREKLKYNEECQFLYEKLIDNNLFIESYNKAHENGFKLNSGINKFSLHSTWLSSDAPSENDLKESICNIWIQLVHKKTGNCIYSYELRIQIDENILGIVYKIKKYVDMCFDNKEIKLGSNFITKMLDNLESRYSCLGFKFSKNTYNYQQIVRVSVDLKLNEQHECFYFNGNGIIANSDQFLFIKTEDINYINEYIIKYCQTLMDEISNKVCIECDTKFTIAKGEIEFLIKKGFNLPKRCKCCRNKRKQQN